MPGSEEDIGMRAIATPDWLLFNVRVYGDTVPVIPTFDVKILYKNALQRKFTMAFREFLLKLLVYANGKLLNRHVPEI